MPEIISITEFTDIYASKPLVVAAKEERTYDKYWMRKLLISSPDFNDKKMVFAEFVPCRDVGEDKELKPYPTEEEIVTIRIDDMDELSGSHPLFSNALEGIFKAFKEYGTSKGLF